MNVRRIQSAKMLDKLDGATSLSVHASQGGLSRPAVRHGRTERRLPLHRRRLARADRRKPTESSSSHPEQAIGTLYPDLVRERLSRVPQQFLQELEVVQLSQMTRKKQSFPCYGMQWGNALYLYPIEESFVETYDSPPRPNLVNESKMYGGRWAEPSPGIWTLTWSEQAPRIST
jgi:hypothetical protein